MKVLKGKQEKLGWWLGESCVCHIQVDQSDVSTLVLSSWSFFFFLVQVLRWISSLSQKCRIGSSLDLICTGGTAAAALSMLGCLATGQCLQPPDKFLEDKPVPCLYRHHFIHHGRFWKLRPIKKRENWTHTGTFPLIKARCTEIWGVETVQVQVTGQTSLSTLKTH